MRYIKFPEAVRPPVPIVGSDGQKRDLFTFDFWLMQIVLNDPRWAESYKTLKLAGQVEGALHADGNGPGMRLEEAPWEMLREVATNPMHHTVQGRQKGYENPLIGRLSITFIAAIDDADVVK